MLAAIHPCWIQNIIIVRIFSNYYQCPVQKAYYMYVWQVLRWYVHIDQIKNAFYILMWKELVDKIM